MNNLSFTLTDEIKEKLQDIDRLRAKILQTPIKLKDESRLRWEADINKAYWGLTLADNKLTKLQMTKLLTKPLPKRLSGEEKEVISYINALRLIRQIWTGTKLPLNTNTILYIYDLSCKSVFGPTTSYFKSKEELVSKVLGFIESGKDNPVIKAGLIQIEIMKLSPFENATGRVARLLSHLMLARFGYDLRGLLVLEDYYRNDLISLKEATNSIEKDKNATKWLEYFTQGVKNGMEKTLKNIESLGSDLTNKSSASAALWKLTDRQNKILEYLENPDLKVTNKKIQKMFSVSTITASRDLTKMANLGILLPHGKGRSVFYTK